MEVAAAAQVAEAQGAVLTRLPGSAADLVGAASAVALEGAAALEADEAGASADESEEYRDDIMNHRIEQLRNSTNSAQIPRVSNSLRRLRRT